MGNTFKHLPFQEVAVQDMLAKISSYDGGRNTDSCGNYKPYLHRLKAVTGSGKTAMLAALAGRLPNSIILWTTPRGAVVNQTNDALDSIYGSLLGLNCEVLSLSEALRDWERICKDTTGLTIIVPTTACWNQDGDKLLIHRDGSWEQLGKRNRDLWVFYDEGHNITHRQLGKLLELSPRGFILSSASPLSAELVGLFKLLPDGTDSERRECLNTQRTTVVKTADVVKAGLLKTTFHLHRRGTDDFPILKEVTDKRQELELLSSEPIIAGYIVGKRGGVEGTERGLDLWKNLIDMGTPAKEIAVHLDGAKRKAAARAKTEPIYAEVEATYDKSKRGEASSFFKKYKHVIWNISLDEGWDEPWASVLYLDNLQKSEIRVTQRIGRFVRNPFKVNGVPCLPDNVALSTVYIYFQGTDKLVEEIADGLEKDMGIVDGDGVDIIVGSGITHQIEPVKRLLKVDKLSFKPNREKIGEYFINEVLHPELSSPSYSGLGDGRDIKISLSGGKREESKKSLPVGITTTLGEALERCFSIFAPDLRPGGGVDALLRMEKQRTRKGDNYRLFGPQGIS